MSKLNADFNQIVLPLRRALLVAGAQPDLGWWPGDVLSPANQNVLTTLLPGTGELAGLLVLERSVRRIGSEQRNEGITIFDFTEPHEVVLRQQIEERIREGVKQRDLPAFHSPKELATWLSSTFELPAVDERQWVVNEQRQHVTTPDPWAGESSGTVNLLRLALLVSALRFSQPGRYLQPVLMESVATQVFA